jgi:general stress protein CsbA
LLHNETARSCFSLYGFPSIHLSNTFSRVFRWAYLALCVCGRMLAAALYREKCSCLLLLSTLTLFSLTRGYIGNTHNVQEFRQRREIHFGMKTKQIMSREREQSLMLVSLFTYITHYCC